MPPRVRRGRADRARRAIDPDRQLRTATTPSSSTAITSSRVESICTIPPGRAAMDEVNGPGGEVPAGGGPLPSRRARCSWRRCSRAGRRSPASAVHCPFAVVLGQDLLGLHHQPLAVARRKLRLSGQGICGRGYDTFVDPPGAWDRRRRLRGPAVHQPPQPLGLITLPHPQKRPLTDLLSAGRQLGDLAASRSIRVHQAGSYSGRGGVPSPASGGRPVITSTTCRSQNRACSTPGGGGASTRANGGNVASGTAPVAVQSSLWN